MGQNVRIFCCGEIYTTTEQYSVSCCKYIRSWNYCNHKIIIADKTRFFTTNSKRYNVDIRNTSEIYKRSGLEQIHS